MSERMIFEKGYKLTLQDKADLMQARSLRSECVYLRDKLKKMEIDNYLNVKKKGKNTMLVNESVYRSLLQQNRMYESRVSLLENGKQSFIKDSILNIIDILIALTIFSLLICIFN